MGPPRISDYQPIDADHGEAGPIGRIGRATPVGLDAVGFRGVQGPGTAPFPSNGTNSTDRAPSKKSVVGATDIIQTVTHPAER